MISVEVVNMKVVKMNRLFDQLLNISYIRWQRILEDFHTMSSFLRKMVLMVFNGLTKEHSIAAYLVAKSIFRLVRKGGLLTTALYLKQCGVCLQQMYGGDNSPPIQLPIFISLTRSGLPRIIPTFHRKKIRRRDDEADTLVQFYLSVFSMSRLVKMAPKVTGKTFESMWSPPTDPKLLIELCYEVRKDIVSLFQRYAPWAFEIPLTQGVSWAPTWKSLPSHKRMNLHIKRVERKLGLKKTRKIRSCFPAFHFEYSAYSFFNSINMGFDENCKIGVLWLPYVRFAGDLNSSSITDICLKHYDKCVAPYFTVPKYDPSLFGGRLGQSLEEGTKRRIFAIGNYINQRLLHPVHDWCMSVLRLLPTDGTFNQTKPFDRLVGQNVVYSYDLKAATDRWPANFIFWMIANLFDRKFADSVVLDTLSSDVFEIPFVKREDSSIAFLTGQPLGYLSSWPLFALSHHLMVWWVADQVHKGRHFNQYAILGDDIVITDEAVALKYKWAVSQLGVEISGTKSLISHRGAGEFAKRFRVRKMSKDISPISFKALKAFNHPYGLLGLHLKYKFKRFSTLLRVGGYGYRTIVNYSSSKNRTIQRLLLLFNKSNQLEVFSDLDYWFGLGQPLNPYLKGQMVSLLLVKLKPRDLTICPEYMYESESSIEMIERTCMRGWITQWLRYLKWYWIVAYDPYVSLDSLFGAPQVTFHYKATRSDPTLVKFGYIWTLWDYVSSFNTHPYVPIIGCNHTLSGVWLSGGEQNRMFLVAGLGLNQPRSGGGWFEFNYLNPPTSSIKYKTLCVADRKVSLDYFR